MFRKLLRNAAACITVPHLQNVTFLPLSIVWLLGLKYKPLQEILESVSRCVCAYSELIAMEQEQRGGR